MRLERIFIPAAFAMASVPAQATTLINFDSLPGMANSPGSLVPVASRLSNQLLATSGVSFSSGGGYVAIVNHAPGCSPCTPTPPNIIGGTTAGNALSYSTPITASFFNPANASVQATTNFVRVLGDWVPLGRGTATMNIFGTSGNLLGTVSSADTGPQGQGPELAFSMAGIHRVEFFSDNATIGFDNFEFGDLISVSAAVPEPDTWAMMLVGFAGAGLTLRRRRVRNQVARSHGLIA